jgi:hypothetical protein
MLKCHRRGEKERNGGRLGGIFSRPRLASNAVKLRVSSGVSFLIGGASAITVSVASFWVQAVRVKRNLQVTLRCSA